MNASAANRKAREGIRAAADLEPRLRSQYQASLRATARRTTAAYRAKSEVILAAADPNELRSQPTVDEVFDATAAAASATARTRATRRRLALLAGGPLLVDSILAKAQRDYFAPLVEAQAGAQAERLVAGTRDAVASVMLDSLTEGWSVPETADALLEKLTLDADWRATMLARTDLVSLSNGASHQAALSHGEAGPQFKRWLTAGDDAVRETHQEAGRAAPVPIGDPFIVGGAALNFPGDWLGPDDETINCRCVSVYVASEDAELAYSKSPDPLAVAASAANLEPVTELVAATVDHSGSSMIALYPTPEQAQGFAVDGGLAPEDLHVTLAFLPAGIDVIQGDAIMRMLAGRFAELSGSVAGVARFAEGEDGVPIIALPSAVGLNELRADLVRALDALGIEYAQNWGFVPHMTVTYGQTSDPLPQKLVGEVIDFAAISMVRGLERHDYPLIGDEPMSEETQTASVLTADASGLVELLDAALAQAAAALDTAFAIARTIRDSSSAEELVLEDRPVEDVLIEGPAAQANLMPTATPTGTLMASVAPADGIEKTGIEVPIGEWGELSNLTAAAAGLAPLAAPSEWFETPEADGPTALTIDEDGRVYGHAATWGVCHTGKPGGCTTAPRSRSGYDYFHLGVVDTADGMTVPVGRVTLDTGHASLTASRGATAAHYDHTGTQAAYVRARDGEHGIWVSGVLNPDLPESKVRALKAAALSGDWRNVNGALELVGLLAVNVPGFPVPRAQAALAASAGEDVELALVAAGIVCDCAEEDLPPLDLDALIEAEVDPQRLRMAMTSAAA